MITRNPDREEHKDLPNMPPDKQREAMELAAQGEEAGMATRPKQEDLPAMPPEKQQQAMGLVPGLAAQPLQKIEPEVVAYRAQLGTARTEDQSPVQ